MSAVDGDVFCYVDSMDTFCTIIVSDVEDTAISILAVDGKAIIFRFESVCVCSCDAHLLAVTEYQVDVAAGEDSAGVFDVVRNDVPAFGEGGLITCEYGSRYGPGSGYRDIPISDYYPLQRYKYFLYLVSFISFIKNAKWGVYFRDYGRIWAGHDRHSAVKRGEDS